MKTIRVEIGSKVKYKKGTYNSAYDNTTFTVVSIHNETNTIMLRPDDLRQPTYQYSCLTFYKKFEPSYDSKLEKLLFWPDYVDTSE